MMTETHTAIDFNPKIKHSMRDIVMDYGIGQLKTVDIINDYIKNIDTDKFTKHEQTNKIVFSCNETGRQFYFEIVFVLSFGGVPRIVDMFYTGNVRDDLINIIINS